ncbi:4-(cytidine 5'-diphospho)-2-C-methyl-D-erythritol kinase [Brachybacterium ginsengisoli]|uniref:4-diphosphocytidyl-2-C-methyl-D-erythritol kinase n=1 Tax=Brachybacterium ginsengisoli TaxID=1331682 RepID=A0A291GY07_9MICO|nr:4-(cytidine 5'-diphospho)-2-C-methyl-D-erythritol kinase [Brachybacterium ginsengisoli]ATG55097.1 4-(cytidine 5'-diphospho)-2-C-methyl-D-erythritol kinase [Brachybacterium ginsengisoli]
MPPSRHRVVVRAPGKINLSLGVGAVDDRGYHALATVFQAVDLYETITATRAEGLSLEVTSEVPGDIPLDGSNLALRAAELLRTEHEVQDGAALHIHKQVPVAGGMGGGSADAAAALVALDRLWGLGLSGERLRALGGRLGADVPFAMLGHTALGRGNGADLTTVLTHGEWTWLLAVPGGHLSTPAVFRRFDEIAARGGRVPPAQPSVDDRQLQALSSGNIELLADTLHNDLQAAAFALHPGLEPVVEAAEQLGASAALVSGSGPTVAVLVEDESQARSIAAGLMRDGLVESCLVARGSAPGASVLEEE